MSYFHPTVGMQHSTVHLASCPPSTPTPKPSLALSHSLTHSLSLSFLYHLTDDSFLSLNSAGCSLGHLKAMSLYCKKIITFIFRTSHYIFFLIVAFRYQLMIKRIQNFFNYTYKVWGAFYATNETKTCTHVTYHDNIHVRNSVELYIRTKTVWHFRPLICYRRCETATNGWLRAFMSDPHKRRLRRKHFATTGDTPSQLGQTVPLLACISETRPTHPPRSFAVSFVDGTVLLN